MPLNYDGPDGHWGPASEGWPTLYSESRKDAERALIACTKGRVVPYGSYVVDGLELRVETPEMLEQLLTYLRESPHKTFEALRDHYIATGEWKN